MGLGHRMNDDQSSGNYCKSVTESTITRGTITEETITEGTVTEGTTCSSQTGSSAVEGDTRYNQCVPVTDGSTYYGHHECSIVNTTIYSHHMHIADQAIRSAQASEAIGDSQPRTHLIQQDCTEHEQVCRVQ
jgi:hypothetical protein